MRKIKTGILNSLMVAGYVSIAIAMPASFAQAQDISPVSIYTESKKDYNFTPSDGKSAKVDVYSRLGSSITLTIPTDTEAGTATATVKCHGTGQWQLVPSRKSGNNCYDAFDYTYPEVHASSLNSLLNRLRASGYNPTYAQIDTRGGQAIYKVTYPVPAEAVDESTVNPQSYTKCVGGTIQSLKSPDGKSVKQHCVFDNTTSSGIIGVNPDPAKNDDMFRIQPGTSAYLEYIDRGAITEPNRLKWIQRDTGNDPDVMMPAGPPSSYSDWDDFIQNKPAVLSNVEGACYPVTLSLCDGAPPAKMPPAPGYCGAAQGQTYPSIADINAVSYGRCYVGTPTTIKEVSVGDKTTFQWACQSDPIGAAPDTMCTANKVVDGKCGNANGRTFTDASQVIASGLCTNGTPSRTPTGAGSWAWSCNPTGSGGKTANCMASAKVTVESCNAMAYEGAMVLVQDLSGSYWDDLPNLRTNMNSVMNDKDFIGWKIGLTSFTDFPSCSYCTPADWAYRKDLDLRSVSTSKSQIANTISSWGAWNGGDTPESQYYALSRTINDFKGQTSMPLNLVLATDATSHTHVAPAALAAQIKNANANLIVLATDNAWSNTSAFYSNFIRSYGIKGSVVRLASDSSNFKTALKAGLTNSYCSDPSNLKGCGPIDGISCGSSALGGTCKSGQSIVPDGQFTYSTGGGKRAVFQCSNQALIFVREDNL